MANPSVPGTGSSGIFHIIFWFLGFHRHLGLAPAHLEMLF